MGYVQRHLCFSAHHQTNEAPKLQQRAKLRLGLGNPASPLVLTTRHSVSVCNTLLLLFLKSASDVSQQYHWYQQEALEAPGGKKQGTPAYCLLTTPN